MSARITCETPEDTLAFGDALGRAARPGLVVVLQGALGAGKTVLAKGMARGLGVAEWRYVTSPTFAIHNVYEGRLRLHHLDLYRLGDAAELEGAGLEEVLYGRDICVIEWPDSFFESLPSDRLLVRFEWGPSGARLLQTEPSGDVSRAVCRVAEEAVRVTLMREETA